MHPTAAAARLTAAAVVAALAPGCGTASTPAAHQATTQPGTAQHAVTTLSAAQIMHRLAIADLPLTGVITYTAVTDPNGMLGRPGGYMSKVAWQDPRAEASGQIAPPARDSAGSIEYGGGIEVFATPADAAARLAYLQAFKPSLGDGYDCLVGSAVLRLSNWLTAAQVQAYRAVFTAAAAR